MNHLQIFTGYYLCVHSTLELSSFEMSPGHVHTGDQNRKSSFLCVVFEHSGTLVMLKNYCWKKSSKCIFQLEIIFIQKELRELDYQLEMNELN